jgi:hypothetical protein
MDEQPVSDNVKTALYAVDLMQKNADDGDKVRSKCYEKVAETELWDEMSHVEKEIVNLVWSHIKEDDAPPEIQEFFDWCIETSNAEDVVEIQMMADALTAEVKANLKEKSTGEGDTQS